MFYRTLFYHWVDVVLIHGTRYFKGLGTLNLTAPVDSLDFDELPTRHRVPHTRLSQGVDVFHDDKGGFLEGDDAQMVVVRLTVRKGLVPGPYGVPQAQGLVLPLAYLHHEDKTDMCFPAPLTSRQARPSP